MEYVLESNNIEEYLNYDKYIDFDNEIIQKKALELYDSSHDEIENIKTIYNYVRDEISHSGDIDSEIVTKTASDVLIYREGICVAKSLLLAALLRCVKIPAGLCYQRLTKEDTSKSGYVIHGLNAVFLSNKNKWVRLDARGNKQNINAEFSTDIEKIAFPIRHKYNEIDYPVIYAKQHTLVIEAMKKYNNRKRDMWDIESIN
ncbi:hypothetical protein FACS18942_06400 [Planctomycetales bacterium]|nr:hypothetical protein FACS18942_06400 [Planctomycetales bacterium]